MTKLFENLWLKIIALFFGLLLWFHVATEKNYTYQLYLPVSKIILKDGLTLNSKPPDSLMVTVSATGKQLMRKKWRSRGLKIIASQFTSGQYDLNLNTSNVLITSTTTDVTLSEILSPSNIKISVDKIFYIKGKKAFVDLFLKSGVENSPPANYKKEKPKNK